MMKPIARVVALVSLAATIAPAVWFCFSPGGEAQADTVKTVMLVSMGVWFLSATAWLWPRGAADSDAGTDGPSPRDRTVG